MICLNEKGNNNLFLALEKPSVEKSKELYDTLVSKWEGKDRRYYNYNI
jgi:hypothetical protein